MASGLLSSIAAASAGVAERLFALPHALSSRHSLGRLSRKSDVPVLSSLTPQRHKKRCRVPSSCSVSRCSWVYVHSARDTGDISGREQRCTARRRSTSSKRACCGEEVCPLLCDFMQKKCCSCICGTECGCNTGCRATAVAGCTRGVGPGEAGLSTGTASLCLRLFSPSSSAIVAGGKNAVACASRPQQQQRRQCFSGVPAGRKQRHAATLPTPPPIFGCTSRGSTYEAVAETVGEDAEAAGAATAARTSQNVLRVISMNFYETCVYEKSHTQPLICCFVTRGSLQSKLLLQPFKELAVVTTAAARSESRSSTDAATHPLFLLIDCDEVPRAAYHARVEHVPSIVVMKKDDGFREIVCDPAAAKTAAEMIQETKRALERLQQQEQQLPAAVQPGPSRYTKNIGIDNLNVYRVGWVAP